METLGSRLKRLREIRGLTIAEISSKTGVPVSTYREWEYGRAIKGEPYVQLAEILGVSLHELITGITPDSRSALKMIDELEELLSLLKKELWSLN